MEPQGLSSPGSDESGGPTLCAVALTTYVIVAFLGSLRLITRRFIVRQLGWDDYIAALALALSTVSTSFNVVQVHNGGGRHIRYLTLPQIISIRKYTDLAELLLIIITCLTKVSIVLFLMRIPNSKRLKSFLWALIFGLVVVNSTCAIVFILQCRPMIALWDPTVQGHCWSIKVYMIWGYVQGGFAVFTDLIVSGLPIAVLWKVQISMRNKIAICALMAMGLLATACCLVRIALFHVIFDHVDPTWSINDLEIWAILEENIGLIAVNLPAMLPLYRYIREKTIPSAYALAQSYRRNPSTKARDRLDSRRKGSFYGLEKRGEGLMKPLPALP